MVMGTVKMRAGSDGKNYEWLEGLKYTGHSCTTVGAEAIDSASEAGTDPGSVAGEPLPPGKCPGTVNGIEVVVDCGTSSESSVTETTPSTSTTTTSTGPDGTKTTTTVTCEGDVCTRTTVTTTTAGGTSTSVTTSATGDKGGICKDSPGLTMCQNSAFTGSCEANFACSGDAAQCATAKAVNESNCLLKKLNATTAESEKYGVEKGKSGNRTGELPGNATVAMGSDRFDSTDALGGAACITDLQITVLTQNISLPMSMVCPWLETLGNVLVTVSFLLAARIFTRG